MQHERGKTAKQAQRNCTSHARLDIFELDLCLFSLYLQYVNIYIK